MRSSSPSVTAGLAVLLALGGCAFRPDGGARPGDDDDDDPPIDAADTTTDAAAPVDARAIDAAIDARPAFDVGSCPEGYRTILNTTSRYRVIDAVPWAAASALCKADLPGATHLAVLTGMGERDAVGANLFFTGEFRRTWLGVWNDGNGERTVTGEPVYPDTALEAGQAVTWIRDLINPFRADPMTASFAALCECDGRPAP